MMNIQLNTNPLTPDTRVTQIQEVPKAEEGYPVIAFTR